MKSNALILPLVAAAALALSLPAPAAAQSGAKAKGIAFSVSYAKEAHAGPVTGRVYVMIARENAREPRLQIGTHGTPFFGKDVEKLAPGAGALIGPETMGYPLERLSELPAGDYYVQGFVNVYTEFKRSDGHTLWMHQDQWEGQHFQVSPGNLYSDVQKVTIDPARPQTISLVCKNVIPPVQVPEDTRWVKRIKFQSKILTAFWGQPMYLGATILLPRGYDENPGKYYPVNYIQGHFSLAAPNGFNEAAAGEGTNPRMRAGAEFSKFWMSDASPEMILVTFQHPCPYYDDSYAVNSPNTGPYGDAILQELIPAVEEQFRIIRQPYARVLSGGSTGGWIALALQIFYPDFFGGAFSLCPDPVDFRYFQAVDIYKDKNAYFKEFGWVRVPTPSDRTTDGVTRLTYQQRNHMELAMGTKNRSGEQVDIFEAIFGPIGPDGYVQPLFDKKTGAIDPAVAQYWKEHYDLREYLQRNWATLGPKLQGKLHIYMGDMDTYFLNPAVKLLEEFLQAAKPAYGGTVTYGDGQPHCWGPERRELLGIMADHIRKRRPMTEIRY
ncbi:MAG: hypothetical protein KIPDCIKN_03545 [Haliscomenobacter sp.]|nr:hypothetical protein [Haliscomenobacter sp.]